MDSCNDLSCGCKFGIGLRVVGLGSRRWQPMFAGCMVVVGVKLSGKNLTGSIPNDLVLQF
ncbi:hypothetical protein Hanom_Chr03g00202421 [Helianthus anomalus]